MCIVTAGFFVLIPFILRRVPLRQSHRHRAALSRVELSIEATCLVTYYFGNAGSRFFVGSVPNEPRRCPVQVWQPSNQRTLMDTAIACSISVSSLLASCGSASSPLLIDVRRAPAFEADTTMLAGATWRDSFATDDWIKFLPHHSDIVVHCVHGHEISKNACAALRAAGLKARYLEGGIEAWTAHSAPTIKKQSALSIASPINAPSKWVARERPKIDRIACPWLI